MSEKLGPRTFGKREELVFLGREISEQRDYSDRVAQTIDEEVHDLIEGAHQSAITVIKEHMAKLTELSKYLIDHETAEGDVLDNLWKGPPPEPDPIPAG
jgi:cell division protease FtsH